MQSQKQQNYLCSFRSETIQYHNTPSLCPYGNAVIILILHTFISLFGEGTGNPLQYSCLENPTDKGAWQATVNGVAKSQTRLSD